MDAAAAQYRRQIDGEVAAEPSSRVEHLPQAGNCRMRTGEHLAAGNDGDALCRASHRELTEHERVPLPHVRSRGGDQAVMLRAAPLLERRDCGGYGARADLKLDTAIGRELLQLGLQ